MATEIKIPVPDQTTEEVRILRWLKKVGDPAKRAEVILEIETEKSAIEVESPVGGVILDLLAEPDQMVPVGKVVGYIGQPDEKIVHTKAPQPQQIFKTATTGIPSNVKESAVFTVQRKVVSPNARRIARENNLDVAEIAVGSGPAGRVIGKDVQTYIAQRKPASLSSEMIELTKMRRAIAGSLLKSWQMSPHFNVAMSIDMTRAIEFRRTFNASKVKTEQVSVNDLLVKAVTLALQQFPVLNSSFTDDGIATHAAVNIGIATAVDAGLVVPVLPNAATLSWTALAQGTKHIIEQARNGKIANAGKGTFTISNLGMLGVDFFTAIINPPEAAILTAGRIEDKVVSVDGMIAIKPLMQVVLCCDHRIVDGAVAAQFLKSLKEFLENKIR